MFGDKYKKDMDKIKAPEDAVARISDKMKAGKPKKARITRYIALAAACVIAVAGIAVSLPHAKDIGNGISVLLNGAGIFDMFTQEESAPQDTDGYATYNQLCAVITDRVNTYKDNMKYDDMWEGAIDEWVDAEEDVPTADGTAGDILGSTSNKVELNDFSDTNNQVSGVQEADVIRTDGKFIYIASGTHFTVLKADKGKLEECCDIDLGNTFWFNDIILCGGKVILIGETANVIGRDVDTVLYVFETDEEGNAEKVNEFLQSGVKVSLRAIGEIIYVVTRDANTIYDTYLKNGALSTNEIIENLPIAGKSRDDVLPPDAIYVPDEICSVDFTLVSAFDTVSGENKSAAIMGSGSRVYADTDTVYVYGARYKWDEEKNANICTTHLTRFSIIDNAPVYTGNASINGSCLNQYSLDEYNGYLRLAVTRSDGQTQNGVVVLDENLDLVGEIMGLGVNERIKSVRFDRETVYLVTFRTTDPLYAVDLSDPAAPKVRSELKLPGYSGYMHPYGDGLLFGFGYDADENSGFTNGLKLSMFDNSDPDNLAEKHTLLLGTDTFFRDNMLKAVSVQPRWNIIMFSYGKWENKLRNVFALYTYSEESGFELLGEYASDMVDSMAYRCFYIDGYVYVVYIQQGDYAAYAFTASDFTLIDSLE